MTVLLQRQLPSLTAEYPLQALYVLSPSCHILRKYKKFSGDIPHNQVKIDVVSLAIPLSEADVPSQGVSP